MQPCLMYAFYRLFCLHLSLRINRCASLVVDLVILEGIMSSLHQALVRALGRTVGDEPLKRFISFHAFVPQKGQNKNL